MKKNVVSRVAVDIDVQVINLSRVFFNLFYNEKRQCRGSRFSSANFFSYEDESTSCSISWM